MLRNISRRLIIKAAEEAHPTVDKKRCVNQIQRKIACGICEAACPAHALGEKIDDSRCGGCGVCAAHCPAGAIAPSPSHVQRMIKLMNMPGDHAVLGCSKSDQDADCRLECLAAYPWEILASLILGGKKLSIIHGKCEGCAFEKQMALFHQEMEQLHVFLGEERAASAFCQEHTPRSITRREAFRSMLGMGKKAAAAVMPLDTKQTPDGDIFRHLLVHRARHVCSEESFEKENAFGWTTPVFGDACQACGICAKVCPNQALHVHAAEDGRIYMAHFAWKCKGCGICAAVCPFDGIEGCGVVRMSEPDDPVITLTKAHPCEKCGAPCSGDETRCMGCRLDARRDSVPSFLKG